jgi:hypothetical protein
MMITLDDGDEIHPTELVTVKLYVPVASPETIVPAPVPDIAPGLIVQVPIDGNPLNTTLPVDTEHVGCVIVPGAGAAGVAGCAGITTFAEKPDKHPAALVTV